MKDLLTPAMQALTELGAVSSTLEKKKILQETKSDLLERIFKQTYHPLINYGVVKLDTSDAAIDDDAVIGVTEFEQLWGLLKLLQERELTGHAAKEAIVTLMNNRPKGWHILIKMILDGDLRTGAGKTLIMSAYPGLFPAKICMLAAKYESKHLKFPIYVDIKLDGVRCIATPGDAVELVSRGGKAFHNFKTIEDEIRQLELPARVQLDGEVMSGHFQELMKIVHKKTDGIALAAESVYNIFDVIMPGEQLPLTGRLDIITDLDKQIKAKGLTHLSINLGHIMEDEESLMEYYNDALKQGFEGVMLKNLSAVYVFDRSRAWMKMKPEETEDLKVVGVEKGKGKYVGTLGALTCELPNGDTVNVGSGFSDEDRDRYWKDREHIIGQVVEVKYQEKTKDGSLRFPVFMKFRPDKS